MKFYKEHEMKILLIGTIFFSTITISLKIYGLIIGKD